MQNTAINGAKILIVDDQQANIDILMDFLEMQGYDNLEQVTDPREVLLKCRAQNYDLILLDLMMPHMSGFEVMQQLKDNLPENDFLPILVLTADVSEEARRSALSAGATDFLSKPFDLIEVGLRIRNILFTKDLFRQIQNQNLILEEKVKERTYRLQKMNDELIIARDKAETGDRLKTAFIQNISHEVRTPLNGILGFAEIMSDPEFTDEEKMEYKPLLEASCDRLLNTITDYMDIAALMAGTTEVALRSVNLSAMVRELGENFSGLARVKNIQFRVSPVENNNDLFIRTDHDLILKAVKSILDNAVKFTKEGTIEFGYRVQDDKVSVFVKDTGIGIPAEMKDRIFDAFAQGETKLTRNYEGNGLGLAIVKGVLKLLHGDLTFTSKVGEGSEFIVDIPLRISETEIQKSIVDVRVSKDESDGRKEKLKPVLVVEDDDALRLLQFTILDEVSEKVFTAADGAEALKIIQTEPGIALVIMDLKMPVMDGYEATRAIKKLRPELPVIALSAYAMGREKDFALEAGCDDFLMKPLKSADLKKKVARFLTK